MDSKSKLYFMDLFYLHFVCHFSTMWTAFDKCRERESANKKYVSANNIYSKHNQYAGLPVWLKNVNKEVTFKVPISRHSPFQPKNCSVFWRRNALVTFWMWTKPLFCVIMQCAFLYVCVCVSLLSARVGYNRGNEVKPQKARLTLLFMLG